MNEISVDKESDHAQYNLLRKKRDDLYKIFLSKGTNKSKIEYKRALKEFNSLYGERLKNTLFNTVDLFLKRSF